MSLTGIYKLTVYTLPLTAALLGCTPYMAPPPSPGVPPVAKQTVQKSEPSQVHPRYHRVARGETLWSVSRRYGVNLETLARVNRIRDTSRIQVGQKLFIPSKTYLRTATASWKVASGRTSFGSKQFTWPVQGRVISIFGTKRDGARNKGVDIQAAEGTDVRAARGGKVSFVHENMPGFGKTVIIDHGDGFASVYAYVGQILVTSGQAVSQQEVIARVGVTGRTQVAALHFEIRRNQKPQNPLVYLP